MKKFILLVLILVFFSGGLAVFWLATLKIPDFASFHDRVVTESTKIYDRTGKVLLYDIHGNIQRKVISFEKISKDIKNATVAIEDSEFYQHRGVKPTAILRAFWINLISGSVQQGGSTITQQLVKNTLLTQEKKITRKIKEVILALKMERVLTKEQILSLYLNENPYGGNIYGVEEAAQTFFGKSASEVDLAEAAYIAAIPKAPTFYSPYGKNRDKLEERKNLVLKRMLDLGFITPQEETAAKAEKIIFMPPSQSGIKAPHFVMFVKDYLEQKYGADEIQSRGFKVITTLDWGLQQKAEEVVRDYGEQNAKNFNAHNAGLVAIDPKTGQILAMVGSRDYFDTTNEGNFNVTLAHRQPGSSFKPFVYAEAFIKGFTPETIIFDVPTQFDANCASNSARCYAPNNYDDKFRGPLTLRNALAQSINLVAIKVLYLAGIRDAINLARNMGITGLSNQNQYGLTLVLGGGEVTPLDMTSAYSVFANDGVRNPYASILKVENNLGETVEEFTPHPQTILPSQITRTISSILSDNQARQPTYAANSPLYFPNTQVAAKTGTTNDYKDAWVIGYTPTITVGTWVGNNDNTPMEKKIAGYIVVPMWRAFMDYALTKVPTENFTPPEPTPENLPPVYRGFWQGNQNYFIDKISGKLATSYTPEETKEEKVVPAVHSILYWLGRTNDPQFQLWEQPVRTWAATQGLVDQTEAIIPTETDDVHTPANQPRFMINSPSDSRTYSQEERIVVTTGDYRGRFPIGQLDVYLNDTFLGSIKQAPYELSFIPQEIPNLQLENKLRVVIYDSVRNKSEETIGFQTTSN
jgi:1A family penicillin-binding protein